MKKRRRKERSPCQIGITLEQPTAAIRCGLWTSCLTVQPRFAASKNLTVVDDATHEAVAIVPGVHWAAISWCASLNSWHAGVAQKQSGRTTAGVLQPSHAELGAMRGVSVVS